MYGCWAWNNPPTTGKFWPAAVITSQRNAWQHKPEKQAKCQVTIPTFCFAAAFFPHPGLIYQHPLPEPGCILHNSYTEYGTKLLKFELRTQFSFGCISHGYAAVPTKRLGCKAPTTRFLPTDMSNDFLTSFPCNTTRESFRC